MESLYVPSLVCDNLNPFAGPIIISEPFKPAALTVNDFTALKPLTQIVSNEGSELTDETNMPVTVVTFKIVSSEIPQLLLAFTITFPDTVPQLTLIVFV